MIQVILGTKGSGKTVRLIEIANQALKEEKGSITFVAADASNMYDVPHDVRFVNASEYPGAKKCTANEFLAFVSGMMASNYDLAVVIVDTFKKLVVTDLFSGEMEKFFEVLNNVSDIHGCKFVLSISASEEEVPEYVKKYVI